MNKFLKYFLLAILFWIVVDFTTVFSPDFQRWFSYMPQIWLFYLGFPLLFASLLYKTKIKQKYLFILVLLISFALELVIFQNTLLYTFPIMLLAIPFLITIYSLITFVPFWIVEKKIKKKKKKTILMIVIWIIISILTLAGNVGGGG